MVWESMCFWIVLVLDSTVYVLFFGKRSYTDKSVKIREKVAFCPTFPHFLPETVSFSAWMFFVWLIGSIAVSRGWFFGWIDRLSGGRVAYFWCRGFPVACGAFLWLLASVVRFVEENACTGLFSGLCLVICLDLISPSSA